MEGHRRTRAVIVAAIGAAVTLIAPTPPTAEAATFVVNDTRDRVDTRPGNGVCRTSAGTCTLRAAIQEANARAGADVITLDSRTYAITRAPLNDNDIATGDLDITSPLTINGRGVGATIVDGGTPTAGSDASRTALDRLFEIHPAAGDVTLSGLTIREGWDAKEGGAIYAASVGTVRLVGVVVRDSFAGTAGGGIFYDGTAGGGLVLERSNVVGNATNGEGGGIHVASGRLTVSGTQTATSTIDGNRARNGGGIFNAGSLGQGGQSAVELTGTTVTGNDALTSGGGIDNRLEGSITLTDVAVSANHSGSDGGGLASSSKSGVTVVRTTFSANRADGSGGGAFTHTEGAVTIDASAFSGNFAGGPLAGDGGAGLAVYGSGAVDVTQSTFSGNIAAGEGGGIAIHSDGPVAVSDTMVGANQSAASGGGILASGKLVDFRRLTVTGNTAAGDGGGIDNQGGGEFSIVDSTIAANTAAEGGGLANRADAILLVSGTTFSDNRAVVAGGGFLHRSDAATEIVNTTLSGNDAGLNGGGLYLDADAGLHVVNTTISANEAPYGSGVGTADAIDNFPVASHPLLVFRNTIVAGNVGGPDCHAAFGSEGGNLDGGTLCNFGGPRDRTNVVPRLAPLALNDGFNLTHAVDPDSPAVGGGVDPCPTHDQRGVLREVDRPCDVGAYEFAGTPEPPPPDGPHPETSLDSGPADTTESTEATFSFSSDDPGASFECSLDGASFTACVSPVALTDLTAVTHTFAVRAVDASGAVDPTPVTFTWTIEPPPDSTPPETRIDSAPPIVTASRDAAFTFSSEAGATFECSLDGVSFAVCTSPADYVGLAAGAHTFAVRAYDSAGNQDATPAGWSWIVAPPLDITPPVATFGTVPPLTTDSPDAVFSFFADEPGSTFTCALDGPSFNLCTSPVALTGLSVGAHSFAVLATDPAGNVALSAAVHNWIITVPPDTTPPETLLASGPDSPTNNTSAQFTFSASESGATFECSLDEVPFTSCVSPVDYGGLAVTDHTFEVRAIDLQGNVDPTPESYTWTIEAPEPPAPTLELSITAGPDSPTESTSAQFVFSATPAGANLECALDGAAFAGCVSPLVYSGLPVGDHTLAIRASSSAGGVDTALYSWTIVAPPACGQALTIVADADAWIDENSSSTNKGDDSILKLQSKAPHDNFRVLVRFAAPAAVPGCVVGSATLRMYAASSTPDRHLQALRLDESWTESTVTWNNQPDTAGAAAVTSSGSGYREWEVTSLVQAMYDAGTNHGFLIRDEEGGAGFEQQFHGREKGENPPILVISFAPTGP